MYIDYVWHYIGLWETLNICVSYEIAKYLVLKERSIFFFFLTIDQHTVYNSMQHQSSKSIMWALLYGVIQI